MQTMKRLLIPFIWIFATLSTISSSLVLFSYHSRSLLPEKKIKEAVQEPRYYKMYLSHPETLGESTVNLKTKDALPQLIYQYLEKYNSPMKDTAPNFVKIFREFSIDPIIPLAIAQCESNLGIKMPPNCHNPFGLGIHSQGTLCFNSWEKGYRKMAKILKENLEEFKKVQAYMKKFVLKQASKWKQAPKNDAMPHHFG